MAAMTFRIHFTLPDGTDDSIVISADTVDEMRALAGAEIDRRKAVDPWSEEL